MRNTFVGRERELAELVSACESGADNETNLFLISGEPGIGKTRLANEVASRARARGLQVLWGRCWEGDGAPAYWPWIQVIRGFLGALDSEQRRLALESESASDTIHAVAQIVPDLRRAQPMRRPLLSENLAPEQARFRLFDAVTNFLKLGARSHPMLIVLDDLHDGDEASLALLRFMARELRGAAISIVATYREVEVRRAPGLSKLVGELSREARSIPVCGLSQPEVKRLVEFRAGQTPDDVLVAKLCAATNGNPLFVDGIVRNLIAEGAIDSAGALERPFKIPNGVREAIRGQLERLSPDAIAILAVAAAIGNEFEFNLCQSVADISADEAHRLLDEASSAGIVSTLSQCRHGFSHALIREALYEELDTNNRITLHRQIAERMEEICRADIVPHLSELAHHYREAGVSEKAIEYSIRAGEAAISVGANAEAMKQWEAALALMEQLGSDARRRAELLEWLGDGAFAIDQPKSVRYRTAAIALNESAGRIADAARVRVRLGRSFAIVGQPITNGARAIEQLRRAEAVLAKGPETSDLAWLYEGLAAYEQQRLNLPRRAAAAQRAMEICDRIGDKNVWSRAAGFYGFTLAVGGRLKEAFEYFARGFEAADQADLQGSGHAVTNLAAWCCELLGDPRSARAWHELELNRPRNAHSLWDHREKMAAITSTYYEEGQMAEVLRRMGPEDLSVRVWVRGEWDGLPDLLEAAIEAQERADDRVAHIQSSYVLGTFHLLFSGDYARAEAHLKYGLDNGDRGPLVIDEMRVRPFLAMAYVGMHRFDDADEQLVRCRQVMAAGEDWRGRAGTVAWAEAVVAAAHGNHGLAERQFKSAAAIQRKYYLAMDECLMLQFWGRALAAAGDRIRAAEKFGAAIELNRARGVGPRFIQLVQTDKERALGTTPALTDIGGAKQSEQAERRLAGAFQREGEFWTVTFDDATFRLKDAKGLRYIAYLLARPGQRIHVLDLIEAVEGSAARRRTMTLAKSEDLEIVRDIGGAGPTLDARARSDYRARLRDLDTELEESERMNDLGRSERLRNEVEVVGQELAGSFGLGGRARSASGSAERARGLVGKNIRLVLQVIRQENPALRRHFATAISTGFFCAYQPEPDQPISWRL